MRYGEKKVAKKEFYDAKKTIKIWHVDVANLVISKFIETKIIYKCLIGYLDEAIRPLLSILPKMSGFVKTFKEKNKKLMSLHVD